ncbi:MAG: hypothetical protein WA705_18205 [Candidatus Ozemobacteraceae bacterium]
MKTQSKMRVNADVVSFFLDQLNALSEAVVKAAADTAKQDARTTIMLSDIQAAMGTITGSTSDLPFLFKQLEALTAKDTANLAELIQKWIDTH